MVTQVPNPQTATVAAVSCQQLTVGVAVQTPGKAFAIFCTTAGNVVIQFADGTLMTIPVAIGVYEFNYSITQVISAGTTATATYWNLY